MTKLVICCSNFLFRFRFCFLATLLGCGDFRPESCAEDGLRDLAYTGPCVAGVRQHGRNEFYVSSRPRCAWERMVNLTYFEGFRPGMTNLEARRLHGTPTSVERNGRTAIWNFQRPMGTVSISLEDQGSSLLVDRWWLLSAYPLNQAPAQSLSAEVLQSVGSRGNDFQIVILNGCGFPAAEISFERNRVARIRWLENAGSWHSRMASFDGTREASDGDSRNGGR